MAGDTALVLGANGQDGMLLCQTLLRRGVRVVGAGRQAGSRLPAAAGFDYQQQDLRDNRGLARLLNTLQPSRIFHVAAVHGSAAQSGHGAYETLFDAMLDVNVKSVHTVLEYQRTVNPEARFSYASSAKVFGSPLPEVIDDSTPKVATCLYSTTKIAAGSLIDYYRRQHGVAAQVLLLFNHESEYRPQGFFIPKLAACLDDALSGRGPTEFFTLRFHCDWGSAAEYMALAADLLERAPGRDVIVASGRCVDAYDMVQALFAAHGLRAADHVREQRTALDPPSHPYRVDLSPLRAILGRVPEQRIEALIEQLVQHRRACR